MVSIIILRSIPFSLYRTQKGLLQNHSGIYPCTQVSPKQVNLFLVTFSLTNWQLKTSTSTHETLAKTLQHPFLASPSTEKLVGPSPVKSRNSFVSHWSSLSHSLVSSTEFFCSLYQVSLFVAHILVYKQILLINVKNLKSTLFFSAIGRTDPSSIRLVNNSWKLDSCFCFLL